MVASVALLAWTKAISDANIASLIEKLREGLPRAGALLVDSDRDRTYSLRLDATRRTHPARCCCKPG